ncbi:hypothetical protein MBANPS3_003034 [Mucor bainieri]
MLILGGVFCKESGASLIKMHFYFLLTLTLILAALLANQHVSAAAIGNQDACIKRAYTIYDALTQKGCDVNLGEDTCRARFDFAVKNLNADLDKCERSDYVTLCRIIPRGGFFSSTKCTSVQEDGKLTKADCEVKKAQDFPQKYADGSSLLFKAVDSKCVNTLNYNCHELCG